MLYGIVIQRGTNYTSEVNNIYNVFNSFDDCTLSNSGVVNKNSMKLWILRCWCSSHYVCGADLGFYISFKHGLIFLPLFIYYTLCPKIVNTVVVFLFPFLHTSRFIVIYFIEFLDYDFAVVNSHRTYHCGSYRE